MKHMKTRLIKKRQRVGRLVASWRCRTTTIVDDLAASRSCAPFQKIDSTLSLSVHTTCWVSTPCLASSPTTIVPVDWQSFEKTKRPSCPIEPSQPPCWIRFLPHELRMCEIARDATIARVSIATSSRQNKRRHSDSGCSSCRFSLSYRDPAASVNRRASRVIADHSPCEILWASTKLPPTPTATAPAAR